MGVTLNRKKKRNLLLSFMYRLSKISLLSKKKKFKLLLDLEWIFERLSHEMSFKFYTPEGHPLRIYSTTFLMQFIEPDYSVLDLGCKYGDISYVIASKAKKVIGIDLDKTAIEKANLQYTRPNLSFELGDALVYLNKTTEKFDVLILSHILEHLEQPKEFINKFKGFVDYLYIEVPDFDKSYLNYYRKELNCDLIYTDIDHITEFDRSELIGLIKECGLVLLSSEYRFGVQRYWLKVTR